MHAWDGDLSYQELDVITSKAAVELQKVGFDPEMIVTLRFEKSKWAVVAVLAVCKAGAALVFIDTEAPPQRVKYIRNKLLTEYTITSNSLNTPEHLQKEKLLFIEESVSKPIVSNDTITVPSTEVCSSNAYLA